MSILKVWFEEVWNQGREDAIDELSHVDTKGHGIAGPGGNELEGTEAFKVFYRDFRSSFSNIHVEVEDTVSEGDKTVARCLCTAVQTSSGKPVRFTGQCMARVQDGKIIEVWNNFDFLTMNQQLV